MAAYYNPIVQTFGRLRAAMVDCLDLPRWAIRPETPLDLLFPIENRREQWDRLEHMGLDLPSLELPRRLENASVLAVAAATVSWAVWFQEWTALLAAFSFGRIARTVTKPWATCMPCGLVTVGELALYLTSYRDHKHSGYRWTHNEISFKVRQIVAESLGLRLDEVHENSTWTELEAD
jgi:hypothetical protein